MEIDAKQQEIIYQLSLFEQQMQQIRQQMQTVEQGIIELKDLDKGLDNLKGKKDKEILAQIGRGIFVKAKLISEDLTVDIGGKNFIVKSISETKEMINEQINKLEDVYEQLTKSLNELNMQMIKLIDEVQKEKTN